MRKQLISSGQISQTKIYLQTCPLLYKTNNCGSCRKQKLRIMVAMAVPEVFISHVFGFSHQKVMNTFGLILSRK